MRTTLAAATQSGSVTGMKKGQRLEQHLRRRKSMRLSKPALAQRVVSSNEDNCGLLGLPEKKQQ
jgi:hypothetical protein